MFCRLGFFTLFLFSSHVVQARVFDFKSATVAPYIRGTGGTTPLGQDAFIHGSGVGTTLTSKSNYNYSGEVGLNMKIADIANLRLGAELISAIPVSNARGTNAAGAERFSLNSNLTVFNPNATIEVFLLKGASARLYSFAGIGYGVANLTNSYTMTSTGTDELGGLSSYDEKAVGSSLTYTVGMGFETVFSDNVTLSLDAGYRYLQLQNMTHTGPVTTIAQGSVAKGDVLKNPDGTARRLDLGGAFVGLTFRFYINFGR